MKKLGITLVAMVAVFSLSGCGCQKKPTETTKPEENVTNPDGTLKENVNTNEGVVKEQVVGNITLKDVNVVSTAYSATIRITATNNTDSDVSLSYFKIILKDKDGKNILGTNANGEDEFAVAPVYGTIKAKESKTLNASIDRNLDNVASFEYELVK